MAKFDIPRFKYLCQEQNGDVLLSADKPINSGPYWYADQYIYIKRDNPTNDNYQDTLIDLDVDDYEFEDGILRRIENDTTKN